MHADPDPGGRLRPTGWRLPAGIAFGAAVPALFVTERFYGAFPVLPWTAVPTLLLLAMAEFVTAYHTRRRIRREPGTEPVEPLSAARLLALARASAVFGAAAAGWFAGMVLALSDRLAAPGPREDALTAAITMLAALVLLGAGLVLERSCRVPEESEGGR